MQQPNSLGEQFDSNDTSANPKLSQLESSNNPTIISQSTNQVLDDANSLPVENSQSATADSQDSNTVPQENPLKNDAFLNAIKSEDDEGVRSEAIPLRILLEDNLSFISFFLGIVSIASSPVIFLGLPLALSAVLLSKKVKSESKNEIYAKLGKGLGIAGIVISLLFGLITLLGLYTQMQSSF